MDRCSDSTCTGDASTASAVDLSRAVSLQIVTLVWMLIEAGLALATGIAASSLALVAFGADSLIELISAIVVYRHLKSSAGGVPEAAEAWNRRERRTATIAGYLLLALAGYVLIQAAYGIAHPHAAETSWIGIGVTAIAALGMPWLARAKLQLAQSIGSRALRADAMEALTCGYLSWVVLAGLAAHALLGWWWLDAATAVAIVPLLIKEGREAIRGECSCEGG